MSNEQFSGTITDVFFHRFVLHTPEGKILADIGPKAAERRPLKSGEKVRIEGERKPSEIKVARIAVGDGEMQATQLGEKSALSRDEAEAIAREEGYLIVGALTPKKKHYEASATKEGREVEIHIHADGVREH